MTAKRKLLIGFHLFLFVSTVLVTVYGVIFGFGTGQRGELLHFEFFKTFTIDSNVLNGLGSLCVALFLLKNQDKKMPGWLCLLEYASAVSVGLTFVVVLVFLAPMGMLSGSSFFSAFAGPMFFFHFLNPILSVLGFVFGNTDATFGRKENFLGTIPLILYALFYITASLKVRY